MKVYLISVVLFMIFADNVQCSKPVINKIANDKKEEIVKHQKEKPTTDGVVKKHYIYPRTGRLFTADAKRDNLIFDSLERTNFMRRADYAIPHKRYQRDVFTNQRKHFLFRSDAEKNKLRNRIEENKQNEVEDKGNALHQSKGFLFTADVHKRRSKRDTTVQINESYEERQGDNKANRNKDVFKYDKEHENKPTKLYKTKLLQYGSQEKKDNENRAYEESMGVLKGIYIEEASDEPDQVDRKKELTSGLLQSADRPTERRLVPTPYLTAKMDVPVVKDYSPVADGSDTRNDEDKDLAEGRSRRKLKKYALPFLLALKMKTAILLPLMFGIVTLIAFKGLWAGITALGISAALGLKALINNSSKVLYEIRTPHYYHYAPPDYAEYWSRRTTGDDPYRAYRTTAWR